MIIIGEKINGAIPSVKKAIEARNAEVIKDLAARQSDAGANYLDVCAGTSPDQEYDALAWLIDVVQDTVGTPICIDSPDPHMLVKVFPNLKKPGLINSISLEGDKCDVLLPLLKDNPAWGVIALCCDQSGIAEKAENKVKNAFQLINMAAGYGIEPKRMHIDPLVLALSAVNDSALNFFEAIRQIKAEYPTVNVTAALSNISFGMPVRKLVNVNFLTLSMEAGLDSVIADPLNRNVIATLYATEALLAKDAFCRKYNTAYRKGLIGEPEKA
jgi:5-methyltetrahydrofolate corrinoid/iron sulfur protein methyltransferase